MLTRDDLLVDVAVRSVRVTLDDVWRPPRSEPDRQRWIVVAEARPNQASVRVRALSGPHRPVLTELGG